MPFEYHLFLWTEEEKGDDSRRQWLSCWKESSTAAKQKVPDRTGTTTTSSGADQLAAAAAVDGDRLVSLQPAQMCRVIIIIKIWKLGRAEGKTVLLRDRQAPTHRRRPLPLIADWTLKVHRSLVTNTTGNGGTATTNTRPKRAIRKWLYYAMGRSQFSSSEESVEGKRTWLCAHRWHWEPENRNQSHENQRGPNVNIWRSDSFGKSLRSSLLLHSLCKLWSPWSHCVSPRIIKMWAACKLSTEQQKRQ